MPGASKALGALGTGAPWLSCEETSNPDSSHIHQLIGF